MNNQIAQDIYQQLGGGRFTAMTGIKTFVWDDQEKTLRIHLTKNASKANRLYIKYNWDDTYTMRFFSYRAGGWRVDHKRQTVTEIPTKETEVKTYDHVYCDQLQELFTAVTGQYTRLF